MLPEVPAKGDQTGNTDKGIGEGNETAVRIETITVDVVGIELATGFLAFGCTGG